MTMLSEHERTWWRDRLDAYLDHELDGAERSRFEALAALDPLLDDELALSRSIQRSLRMERAPLCPDRVTSDVMAHVNADVRNAWTARIRTLFIPPPRILWRPVLAVAVLVAVVVVSALPGTVAPPSDPTVAVAMDDVKWTLAYLSEVGSDTGDSVRNDVLEPIVQSLVQN